jgi:hypothetical protein
VIGAYCTYPGRGKYREISCMGSIGFLFKEKKGTPMVRRSRKQSSFA